MVWCALAIAVLAAQDAPQTGAFTSVFKERHPSGALKEIARRYGWDMAMIRKEDPGAETRAIEEESFEVRVPRDYDAAKPAGLLVWITPGDSGGVPPGWPKVLAARNIIVVGANKAGNPRLVWDRARLALDAVHNLSKQYAVDKKRVYVTGFSGGGRTASRLGLAYPDVFTGGIYMGGMDYFKAVPNPANPKEVWPAIFPKPAADLLKKTKQESRHVVLVGSEDFNRPPSKAMSDDMQKKESFAHVAYFEMPEKDHEWADAEWLEKSLEFLDMPPEPAKKK